ncbi:MAG: GrpB family protein [Candidatus Thorarchaeota archaeon]|nr:GrpB family protein [Candidatus Thorarchaeota archaeon]
MITKPIIDIDVVIQKSHFEETKTRLEEIGFSHLGDLRIAGREAFDLVDSVLGCQFPPHHLYVCDTESNSLHRHIAFREYLRGHPNAADEYSKIKLKLVKRHSRDREKYFRGKDSLVRPLMK